jgi:flagellin
MDGLYLSNAAQVLLKSGNTQNQLETSVKRLSSGLRINSAADDPSGLAIADTLSAQASGFQRAAQNVQDANNALAVADGALANITSILQRIRTLIVQSNSDVNSANDDQDIQSEINQALAEINKISQNTQFNGRSLLDGSLDNTPAQSGTVTQILNNGDDYTVANADGLGDPGPLITQAAVPGAQTGSVSPIYYHVTVAALIPTGAVDPLSLTPVTDPLTGNPVAGYEIVSQAYSSDPNFGPEQSTVQIVPSVNFLPVASSVGYGSTNNPQTALSYLFSNLTPADVGKSITFVTTSYVPPKTGTPLNVQDGANEGNTVGITIQGTSTSDLGISNISVLPPIVIDDNLNLSQSSSNQLAATDAEYRVDDALTQIAGQRAVIGAQINSLNEDADNDQVAATNLTASESSIRDTDIGSEVTTFTRLQVIANFQQTLLSKTLAISQLILKLVS